MDQLRARAFLDLLLGADSRLGQGGAAGCGRWPGGRGSGRARCPSHADRAAGDLAGLADRPGELGGLGPVDPWLARDLAAAAARNPRTTCA